MWWLKNFDCKEFANQFCIRRSVTVASAILKTTEFTRNLLSRISVTNTLVNVISNPLVTHSNTYSIYRQTTSYVEIIAEYLEIIGQPVGSIMMRKQLNMYSITCCDTISHTGRKWTIKHVCSDTGVFP